MESVLKCPKCGAEMEPSLALLKAHQDELKSKDAEIAQMRKMEIAIRQEKNLLEDQRKTFELDKQRQLDAERKKIIDKTTEELQERQRMKDRENALYVEGLKKALEDAQRKVSQGSQQLQGEVQELDLEAILGKAFVGDVFEPIEKGVLGADLRQRVKSPRGFDCGSILWESKRTKTWSDAWLAKLKEDVQRDGAHVPALVTEVLPADIKRGMGSRDGVWIVGYTPELIVVLASLLRKSLLDAAKQKVISESRQSKSEEVYEYITSHEFSQTVESMIGIYVDMRDGINREKLAYEKLWKQREMQVTKLLQGVSGIYGSIQGLTGSTLPAIKALELEL